MSTMFGYSKDTFFFDHETAAVISKNVFLSFENLVVGELETGQGAVRCAVLPDT